MHAWERSDAHRAGIGYRILLRDLFRAVPNLVVTGADFFQSFRGGAHQRAEPGIQAAINDEFWRAYLSSASSPLRPRLPSHPAAPEYSPRSHHGCGLPPAFPLTATAFAFAGGFEWSGPSATIRPVPHGARAAARPASSWR